MKIWRSRFSLVAAIILFLSLMQTTAAVRGQGEQATASPPSAHAFLAEPAVSSWMPSYAYVETGPFKLGGRYVMTKMLWSDVSGFGEHSTYEQDFSLNNYPNRPSGQTGTYFARGETIDKRPAATYWASNLPNAYLDTRFNENRQELAFTIGSGNAHDIRPNVEYYTFIVMPDGDANVDTGKLRAQLGYQWPQGCTDSWCSFSQEQVYFNPNNASNPWDIPVPGSISYGSKPSAAANQPQTKPPQTGTQSGGGQTCAPQPVVTQGLVASPSWVRPGEDVTVMTTIANQGCQAFSPQLIGVGGRGPGGAIEDVQIDPGIVIAPGGSWTYIAKRAFPSLGDRNIFVTYRSDAVHWHDIPAVSGQNSSTVIHVQDLPQYSGGNRLGGFDLDRACRDQTGDGTAHAIQLDPNDPYSWKCVSSQGQTDIDLNAAAQAQYGPGAYAVYEGTDWVVYQKPGVVSQDNGGNTTPSTGASNGSQNAGSQAAERLGPFDLDRGCKWLYNDSSAHAVQVNTSDPFTWRCVVGSQYLVVDLNAIARYEYGDGAYAVLEGQEWAAYQGADGSAAPSTAETQQVVPTTDANPTTIASQTGSGQQTPNPDQGSAGTQNPPTSVPTSAAPNPPATSQSGPTRLGPFDLDRGCRWQEQDDNAYALQLDSNDPYSWRCVSQGQQDNIDLDSIAVYEYGPGSCAFLGDDGYWFAGVCGSG